jgi:hypothetical protein
MKPGEHFWEFYHKFRTLARKAGMNDQVSLKMDLKDKISSRLRTKLFNEYRTARTLEDYVEAIQTEDQGQIMEHTYYGASNSPAPVKSNPSSRHHAKDSPRERDAPIYASAPAYRSQPNTGVQHSGTMQTSAPGGTQRRSTQSPGPQNSARADTPRAQTPANAPRHYSTQPPNRGYPSRINEIEVGDDGGPNSDNDIADDTGGNADLHAEEEHTSRAKDLA